MTNDTATEQPASEWHQVTLALLGGLTVASVLFAHIEAEAPSSNASRGRASGRSIRHV